jgi:hypothetical protein
MHDQHLKFTDDTRHIEAMCGGKMAKTKTPKGNKKERRGGKKDSSSYNWFRSSALRVMSPALFP